MIIDIRSKLKKQNDEMLPIEEWDGSAWKVFWQSFITPNAERCGVDEFDIFASFIKNILKEDK